MAPNVTYGTYAYLSIKMTSKDYNDPIKATRHLRPHESHPSLGREDENTKDATAIGVATVLPSYHRHVAAASPARPISWHRSCGESSILYYMKIYWKNNLCFQ